MRNYELVVLADPERMQERFVASLHSFEGGRSGLPAAASYMDVLARLTPLFPSMEMARTSRMLPAAGAEIEPLVREMSRYHTVVAPAELVEEVVRGLVGDPGIEAAYWKPEVENPMYFMSDSEAPAPTFASSIPNFEQEQGYLGPAPGGVDAPSAWRRAGGRGDDVRVIDIEGGWQFAHIDLLENNGGLMGGQSFDDIDWRNHGTAVLGEIGGDSTGSGVTGIAPNALLGAISHRDMGSSRAIIAATKKLRSGDIMLLEMHRPGPRFNYQARQDQRGYVCVEWWPDDLLAIQYAVQKGIIVVEAAGNGAENLDDSLYDSPASGFPGSWRNPLRGAPDSGAILVGAGETPRAGVSRDRSRLDFSNYGSRLDCQGWGRDVVTTGYGDLFRLSSAPVDDCYWYTSRFSGTSSASPIVAAAAACVQGVAKKHGALLGPTEIRRAFRETGSGQQFNVDQRIGSRPDLQQLLKRLVLIGA